MRICRVLAYSIGVAVFTAESAHATGDIFCQSPDDADTYVALNVGTLPVLHILAATIGTPVTVYSTRPQEGETEIAVGHAAMDGDLLIADFTDPNIERIMISVRLLNAQQGEDHVQAGTLAVLGEAAHAVVCEGP